MTLRNNRAPFLSNMKLCASYHCHMWIQTGVKIRKRLNWVLTCVILTFDLWTWPFAWMSLLSVVITPENFMIIRERNIVKKVWQTDRWTSFSMNKLTIWCKSGWVSLVSSSCLYKTQPERALAQVCHTRIDALSPDEYQFHLLLHRNSQATYPKWLNHLENHGEMFYADGRTERSVPRATWAQLKIMAKLVNISTYFGSQINKQLMGVVDGTKYMKKRSIYLYVLASDAISPNYAQKPGAVSW